MKTDIQAYKDEFTKWTPLLENYQSRFKENYKRYSGTFEQGGTKVRIADPVAFELVERVIQKLYEREPKFYVESVGVNIPDEVKQVVTSLIEHTWVDPDTVSSTGTMRSKLKVLAREFLITGNAVTEVFWNAESDSPDFRIVPIEDVIFDPTKTLKTSPVYYIRKYVSMDYLEDNVEIKKDGKTITGMFDPAAIKKLKKMVGKEKHESPDGSSGYINRTGTENQRQVDEFQLISRWEKGKCCRFLIGFDDEKPLLVQEFESVLKEDPLDFVMDVEVVKEPYAMSLLDPQSGLFKAKDLILSQTVDYGSKLLNPPTIVDPAIGPINLKTVANMYKFGGIVLANPQQIKQEAISVNPQVSGLALMNFIEQRAESISGIGAYTSGVPNQTSDKTQGTKGGIQALIGQAASPVADRQINIEEGIIEPVVNKWLTMIGATMSAKDFKWAAMSGQEKKWVKVTKGLLTGKIKMVDLMDAEVIKMPDVKRIVDIIMEDGKDPSTHVLFDVDWVIKVETGSMAESKASEDLQNKQMLLQSAQSLGIPIDKEKFWREMAANAGLKNPDQYMTKAPEGQVPQVEGGQDGAGGEPTGAGLPGPTGAGNQPNVPQMAGPAGMGL